MEEARDVAAGLWIWRLSYPDWREAAGWPEVVTSTCVWKFASPAAFAASIRVAVTRPDVFACSPFQRIAW